VFASDVSGARALPLALALLLGCLGASALVGVLARRRLGPAERVAAERAVAGVRRANLVLALPLAALVVGVFELGVLLLALHALLALAVVQRRLARLELSWVYRLSQLSAALIAYAGLVVFLFLVRGL